MSVARHVMAIVASRKIDELLEIQKSDIPIQPQVAWLAPIISSISNDDLNKFISITTLKSIANMVVFGKHCVIFDDTEKSCTVDVFSESSGKLDNVPIVDVAVAYDCPYQYKTFLLLMQNALYIPELEINLRPPFIVRESEIQINECPKIQTSNPSIDHHSIYILSCELRIPFNLLNNFSYFETRIPTVGDLETCYKVFITPDSSTWNLYSNYHAFNE